MKTQINLRYAFQALLFVVLFSINATYAQTNTPAISVNLTATNKVQVHIDCPAKPSVQVMIMDENLHIVHNQYFKTHTGTLDQTFDLHKLPVGDYGFYVMIDNKIEKKEVRVQQRDNRLSVAMK